MAGGVYDPVPANQLHAVRHTHSVRRAHARSGTTLLKLSVFQQCNCFKGDAGDDDDDDDADDDGDDEMQLMLLMVIILTVAAVVKLIVMMVMIGLLRYR